jgi:hypothetical protein
MRLPREQRLRAGLDGLARRREVGLADLEVDHARGAALELEGALHHLHREERLDRSGAFRPRMRHGGRLAAGLRAVKRSRATTPCRSERFREAARGGASIAWKIELWLLACARVSKGVQIAFGHLVARPARLVRGHQSREDRHLPVLPSLAEFRAGAAEGKAVRVHGYVALGSIERDVREAPGALQIVNEPPHQTASAEPMPVLYGTLRRRTCSDGAEVVLEAGWPRRGLPRRQRDGEVPSKFEAKTAERAPF